MTQTKNGISSPKSLLRQNDQILFLSTIENTKSRLTKSLIRMQGLPSDFVSTDRLLRPSFSFIHTVIKLFIQQLSFARNLYDDEKELVEKDPQSLSRQEKIKFLFKMLLCVSLLTNERMDIFVSPAKVLAGHDVHVTLLFLQCLSKAVEETPPEASMKIASEVVKNGVTAAYKKSIKTRSTIVRIQSMFRGNATRSRIFKSLQLEKGSQSQEEALIKETYPKGSRDESHSKTEVFNKESIQTEKNVENQNLFPFEKDNLVIVKGNESRKKLKKKIIRKYSKDRPEVNSRRGKQNHKSCMKFSKPSMNDLKKSIVCIDKPNNSVNEEGNEIKPETRDEKNVSEKSCPSPATIQEKKVVKKFKIINGIKTKQEIEIIQHVEKKTESPKKNEEEEVTILLSQLKTKMKNLQKKEMKLNEKVEAARQKEEHLEVCESRVGKLAESLRNKQQRLVQERKNQNLELDKLRLELSEAASRHRFDCDVSVASVDSDQDDKYEVLWKRACDHPTITDLRLKLEAKERSMRKRQDRLIKLEKELIKRMGEVEEEKKQIDDEKKAMIESKKKSAERKKRKPLKHNREEMSKSPQTRKLQKKDEDEGNELQSSPVFTGIADLHPSLLLHLAQQVSSERDRTQKLQKAKESEFVLSNLKNQSNPNLRDTSTPRRRNIKSQQTSRKKSGGNISPQISETKNESTTNNEFPKSLVRYTTHYNNIERHISNNDLN